MKKFLTITVIILSMMVFVACGGSSKKDNTNSDTTNDEDTSDTETADDADTSDTETADDADTSDTETPDDADTSDTETPDDADTSDTETPDNADTSDDGDTDVPVCTGLSLDWSEFTHYQTHTFYVTNEDYDPVLQMQFYQNMQTGAITAGTYDLGSEINASYETCTECVFVQADLVGEGEDATYSKIYYQKSGTLKIDAVDDSNEIKGTIKAVFAEATIDDETLETIFVTGGACLEVETASFDSGYEEPCVPQCDGKQCGSDGCGGSCGTCEGQACSAEGLCVSFSCDSLELGEFELINESSWFSSYKMYEAYVKGNAAGDTNVPDRFTMTFYTYDAEADEWSYKTELVVGSEILADYENDETAIVLYEDYDEEEETVAKYFVQESGTLNFTEVKAGTLESKGNGSVRLMEVDTDLVQVAGGKCYNIENMTWDTICIPNCEGKQCGDDGCGGTCGGCSTDESCSETFQCVADACTTITLDTENAYLYYGSYYMPYTPSAGGEYDEFAFQLYYVDPVIGTHELEGTNYADDTGVFIFVYDETDNDDYKIYFQKKGQVIITAYDEETSNITAEFKDIKLQEVTVDENTYFTSPVPGGKCLSVENTIFTYTASEEEE